MIKKTTINFQLNKYQINIKKYLTKINTKEIYTIPTKNIGLVYLSLYSNSQ